MRFSYITSAELTDVGRRRRNNEDAVLRMDECGVFCVADGMGGAEHGEVASLAIVDAIAEALSGRHSKTDNPCDNSRLLIQEAILNANEWIRDYARQNDMAGMGSTVVILALDPVNTSRAMLFHAGDSRAYRFRNGNLKRLTKDHSLASEAGLEDESKLGPMFQAMVTRAVGVMAKMELEETPADVEEGDLFLLCSDGLTRMVPDSDLAEILADGSSQTPEDLAHTLIDTANRKGGVDNTTVVVVRIGPRQTADQEPEAQDSDADTVQPETVEPSPVPETPFVTADEPVPPVMEETMADSLLKEEILQDSTEVQQPVPEEPVPAEPPVVERPVAPPVQPDVASPRKVVIIGDDEPVSPDGNTPPEQARASEPERGDSSEPGRDSDDRMMITDGDLEGSTHPGGSTTPTDRGGDTPRDEKDSTPTARLDSQQPTAERRGILEIPDSPPRRRAWLLPLIVVAAVALPFTLWLKYGDREEPVAPTDSVPLDPEAAETTGAESQKPVATATLTTSDMRTMQSTLPMRIEATLETGEWGRMEEHVIKWTPAIPGYIEDSGKQALYERWLALWKKMSAGNSDPAAMYNDCRMAVAELCKANSFADPPDEGPFVKSGNKSVDADLCCKLLYRMQYHLLSRINDFLLRARAEADVTGASPADTLAALWRLTGSTNRSNLLDCQNRAKTVGDLINKTQTWADSWGEDPIPAGSIRMVPGSSIPRIHAALRTQRTDLSSQLGLVVDACTRIKPSSGEDSTRRLNRIIALCTDISDRCGRDPLFWTVPENQAELKVLFEEIRIAGNSIQP